MKYTVKASKQGYDKMLNEVVNYFVTESESYEVGDTVIIAEYDESRIDMRDRYTGRKFQAYITYVHALNKDTRIVSVKKVKEIEQSYQI